GHGICGLSSNMAFPSIAACLVCDDIRQETGGKVSLLGFYGIIPNVEIQVADFDQPIERLAFYLSAYGQRDGHPHGISFELPGPDGGALLGPVNTAPVGAPPPAGTAIRLAFAFTTAGLRLPRPGVYRVVIRVDGGPEEHFGGAFSIRLATE